MAGVAGCIQRVYLDTWRSLFVGSVASRAGWLPLRLRCRLTLGVLPRASRRGIATRDPPGSLVAKKGSGILGHLCVAHALLSEFVYACPE